MKWTIRADDKSMGIIRECYAHDACPTYPSNGTYIYPPASSWLIEDYGRYLEQSSTTPGIIFVVLSGAMMSVASIVILLGMFAIRPPKNGCYHFGEEAHGRNDYVAFINAVFFGEGGRVYGLYIKYLINGMQKGMRPLTSPVVINPPNMM